MSLYTPDIVIAPSFTRSSSGVQEAFIWLAFSEFQESYTERGGSQRPLDREINLEVIYETSGTLVFVFSTDERRNDKHAISYPLYLSGIASGIHEIMMRTGTLGTSRFTWEGSYLKTTGDSLIVLRASFKGASRYCKAIWKT